MSIILYILFIHQLYLYITGAKFNAFGCGLFCYCGIEPANPLKLKVLALYNQARGDHSTGLCIDDLVFKDTVPAREYLVKHSSVFDGLEDYELSNNVVLGHCRQATYQFDKARLAFAHPHKTEKKGVDFLRFIHNGTVPNYKDLAEKAGIEIFDKTDSMVLAEIITKNWASKTAKNVLQEYSGAATVIFYPISSRNTLYVHRDQDRELFYWQESKNSMYISSIKDSLLALGADPEDVHEFETGWLIKILNGKISKRWDMTAKTPYYKPIPVRNVDYMSGRGGGSSNSRFAEPVKHVKKDGFYLQDHRVYYNGHMYTGEIHINKETGHPTKTVLPVQAIEFDTYWVVAGIVMKDQKAYNKLYVSCVVNNTFDPGQLKKRVSSDLQAYAMFPIAGKVIGHSSDVIVWHDELSKLDKPDARYTWVPLFSDVSYTANRAGLIVTTVKLAKKGNLEDLEALQFLFASKVRDGGHYAGLRSLHADYETYANVRISFDSFVNKMIAFFKTCSEIPKSKIDEIENLAYDDWGFGYSAISLPDKVSDVMQIYQAQLDVAKDTDVDQSISEALDTKLDGEEYWGTVAFKNDVLFSDYESLKELTDNYLIATNSSNRYRNKLYIAIAKIFLEIGFISADFMAEVRKSTVMVNERTVDILFQDLRGKKCFSTISDIFESGETTMGFVNLYKRWDVLKSKQALSKEEELERELLKLGLRYVSTKAKTLNKSQLLKEFNISTKDIELVCS